jgi:hypothetical protein
MILTESGHSLLSILEETEPLERGGVGVFPRSHKQKILGQNPVTPYPERRALRTQLSCVYANSSG